MYVEDKNSYVNMVKSQEGQLSSFRSIHSNQDNSSWELPQEKRHVNTDPFLHRIYTIGLYTV